MKHYLILTVTIILSLTACDKDKRASKRLMKAGAWEVVNLTVDGEPVQGENSSWIIADCDIYETVCTGNWVLADSASRFYWQFNEKAQVFTLSRIVSPEDCEDFYTEEVEQLTYNFSGDYTVLESKRKRKSFESRETVGYSGKTVRVELERVE